MPNMSVIGKGNTTIAEESGITKVTYRTTDVVIFSKKKIILNTGGWFTNVTKVRMNQASNQFKLGFQVFQKGLQWYVEYKNTTLPFQGRAFVIVR